MRFLFPLSLLLIAGILFFVVVNPIRAEVSQLKADVVEYNTALDNSTELQKTRDRLVDVYKNISQGDKDRLSNFLPNTVNNIRFILEIERIASLHNMPLENIKFKAQENTPEAPKGSPTNVVASANPSSTLPYGVFPVEFTTTGTYDEFNKFLADIEHNLRLVDVKSIGFSVPTQQQGVNNLNSYTYQLKVETYWLK